MQIAAVDDPDTVDFALELNDLPTTSLVASELELVVPACPEDAPSAASGASPPLVSVASAEQPASELRHTRASFSDGAHLESLTERQVGPGCVLHNRYVIERPLGVGGSSLVFSAVDRHRIQSSDAFGKVAVKVLLPAFREDKARVFRLIREFRQMQRLTHAGIARVFDLDCDNGTWFITMELLDGQTLHRHLQEPLKDGEALRILTQCTEAVAFAHEQGVMHGDLKPGNIFVTREGSVRLLDFGSVPDQDEAATDRSPANLAATLAYASPEMLEEKGVDPRDDLFSLGCVAYELFSGGQHPFDWKSSLQARQQNLRPADSRVIQARHFEVIARMLAWERAARPASAREFLHAFIASDFRSEGAHSASVLRRNSAVDSVSGDVTASTSAGVAAHSDAAPDITVVARDRDRNGSRDCAETLAGDAAGPVALHDAAKIPSHSTSMDPTTDLAAIERTFSKPTGFVAESARSTPSPTSASASHAGGAPTAALTERHLVKAEPVQTDLNAGDPHRAGPRSLFLDARYPWLRKTVLVGLGVVAGVLISRLWQPETSERAATELASAAAVAVATAASPAAVVPETPATAQTIAPTRPAAVTAAPAKLPGTAPATAPLISSFASFHAPSVRVSASQQLAVVNIVREKSTAGTARVAVSIVGKTAKPGVDYETPASALVRFNDGQRVRSLYIPLKHSAASARPRAQRSFTVKLQKTSGGMGLGRITSTEVIIGPQ